MNSTAVHRRRIRWPAVVTAILLCVGLLSVPTGAIATISGVMPANAEGEPVDSYTELDALFVWAVTDLGGGRVCIVPLTGSNCDDRTWGTPNVIIGVGSTFSLIEGPHLEPGWWKLIAEKAVPGGWQANAQSGEFVVEPCDFGECPYASGEEDAARFKAASEAATKGASVLCDGMRLWGSISTVTSSPASMVAGYVLDKIGMPTTRPLEYFLQGISCSVQLMHQDIAQDPPDPDFTSVAPPVQSLPAGDFGSAALNEFAAALEQHRALGRATLVAYERYQGAVAAGHSEYEQLQADAVTDFGRQMWASILRSADAARALAADSDPASIAVTSFVPLPDQSWVDALDEVIDRIRAGNFTVEETAALDAAGFTPTEYAEFLRVNTVHAENAVPGVSNGSALTGFASGLEAGAADLDQFVRSFGSIARGLADLNSPGIDGQVKSIELTASTTTPVIGQEVCLSAIVRDANGIEVRGGPLTARLTSSGYVIIDQTFPYRFSLGGDVLSQCFTIGEKAVVDFTLTVGTASGSARVSWKPAPAGNTPPYAVRTSVETKPRTAVNIKLVGGDADGDAVTYELLTPKNGVLTGTAPNVRYTPNSGFTGSDTVGFRLHDGKATSGDAQVEIYVGADAQLPGLPVVSLDQKAATNSAYRQPAPESLRGKDVIDVAGGGQTGSFALTAGGTITAWGGTESGAGPNFDPKKNWEVPVRISSKKITAIESDGNGYNLAVDSNGYVSAWGSCGNDVPRSMSGVKVSAVDASLSAGTALLPNGELKTWVRNRFSDDGDPDSSCALMSVDLPPQLAGERFSQAAAGGLRHAALTRSGDIVTWEVDNVGEYSKFSFPSRQIATIDADLYEVAAATTTGKYFLWNFNLSGSHNNAGTTRLASAFVSKVKTGFGGFSSLFAVTDKGEVRELRTESTSATHLPGSGAALPQEVLGRKVVDVSSGGLGGLALLAPAPPEPPVQKFVMKRLAGDDRYSTAVAISKEGFKPGVPVVYVATGANYPDALSAAPAAAVKGGPMLLVPGTSIPAPVLTELKRLKPKHIVVVGGTGAVSSSVYSKLKTLPGSIERVGGLDRYETSRLLSGKVFGSGATSAYIATGSNFPDALSASAAAAKRKAPVILVPGNAGSVPPSVSKLLTSIRAKTVYIAGGTGVVSPGIASGLKKVKGVTKVTRLAGDDRYATSVAINRDAFPKATAIYLATGTGFADALAGAALAGNRSAPLYVIPPTCVPLDVVSDITTKKIFTGYALGGTGALSKAVDTLTPCKP